MKLRIVLLVLCAVGFGVGLGGLYLSNTRMAADIEQLRTQNQELQNAAASTEGSQSTQLKKANEELARLRKDNEELLRLRNDLRQLREEKDVLSKQVRNAEAQVQTAQAQTAQAKAQAEAIRTNQVAAQPAMGASPEAIARVQALACFNSLRQIDGAKQQWALENNRPPNTPVPVAELARYFPNGTLPACPAGGTYTINAVGVPPTCSIPAHTFNK